MMMTTTTSSCLADYLVVSCEGGGRSVIGGGGGGGGAGIGGGTGGRGVADRAEENEAAAAIQRDDADVEEVSWAFWGKDVLEEGFWGFGHWHSFAHPAPDITTLQYTEGEIKVCLSC